MMCYDSAPSSCRSRLTDSDGTRVRKLIEPTGRRPRQPRLCTWPRPSSIRPLRGSVGRRPSAASLATTCRRARVELLDAHGVRGLARDRRPARGTGRVRAERPAARARARVPHLRLPPHSGGGRVGRAEARVAARSRGRAHGGGAAREARLPVAPDGLPAVRGRVLGPRRGLRPRGQLRRDQAEVARRVARAAGERPKQLEPA